MESIFKFKELTVYKKAFSLAMEIFKEPQKFPSEERYRLTYQIRRYSRSVCTAIAEGYRKRHYPAFFVCKISDADMENSETHIWIDFAFHCKFIDEEMK